MSLHALCDCYLLLYLFLLSTSGPLENCSLQTSTSGAPHRLYEKDTRVRSVDKRDNL